MFELTRTNDPVLISWLVANLRDVGIEALVFDEHASVMDGSILAIARRIMVEDVHQATAKQILAEGQALGRPQTEHEHG